MPGITFPAGAMQKQLLQEVYGEAGVDPAKVAYVEAHGTGTKVGDPQELNAVTDVFCKARQGALPIGSVKSNMGHAEPASGLAAMAKVILAMEEGAVPGNLHYNEPNPDIPGLINGKLQVVTSSMPLPRGSFIGINSFGFGGANVHVILKGPNNVRPQIMTDEGQLVTVAGRTPEGVEGILRAAEENSHNAEFLALLDRVYASPTSLHPYRGYTVLNTSKQSTDVQRVSSEARPVWFVCSGMGVQWPGMARDMMRVPAFKQTMLRLADTLTAHGVDLCDIIASGEEKMLESTPVAFAAIAAAQVALIDVLRSLGIYGDGFIGHSVGELACAYADGCLTAEQTVLCAYWRGKCVSEAKLPAGKMAAIGLTWEETRRRCPADIVAACHNSRDSVTISGPAASVDVFMAELRADDVFVREVASSGVAFHSHQMAQVAPKLKAALVNVIKHPKRRTAKWISTSIPESRWDSALAQLSSADYHVNNLVSPVLFQEGLTHVPDNAIVIEVASHCLLQAILRRSLNDGTTIIGLQNRREEDNIRFFLASIGKCYVSGVNPATCKLRPSAPHFPVLQGTAMLGPLISWDHSQTWAVPTQDEFIVTNGMGECKFEIDLSATSPDLYLLGHAIDGRVLFPATGYLVLVWRALAKMRRQSYESMAVEFNDIDIQRATVIHADGKVTLAVNIMQATGDFQVTEGETLVARGRITAHASLDIPEPLKLKGHGEPLPLCADDVYKELRMCGYDYSGEFQAIVAASLDLSDAKVAWTGNWVQFVDNMMQQIVRSMYTRTFRLPTRIRHIKINPMLQRQRLQSSGKTTVLHSHVNHVLNKCTAGGVEITDLHTSLAPRRHRHDSPTLERHVFVPYVKELRDAALDGYVSACEEVCGRIARALASTGGATVPNPCLLAKIRERTQNQSDAVDSGFRDPEVAYDVGTPSMAGAFPSAASSSPAPIFSFLTNTCKRMRSDVENSLEMVKVAAPPAESYPALSRAALHLLNKMAEIVAAGSDGVVDALCAAAGEAEGADALHQVAFSGRSLKVCVDVALENLHTGLSRVKVVEVEPGEQRHLSAEVAAMMCTQPTVDVERVVCRARPTVTDDDDDTVAWDVAAGPPPAAAAGASLLVLDNVLHRSSNPRATLEGALVCVGEHGFLLVAERAPDFLPGILLDALTSREVTLLAADAWRDLFVEAGLEVVAVRSHARIGALFLLRRRRRRRSGKGEEPRVVSVDAQDFSWVDTLKEEMKVGESGSRICLTANDRASGIVGMVNCLQREPGGDRIRCVLDEEGMMEVGGKRWEEMCRRDLVMNVYREGLWGSFRHLPFNQDEDGTKMAEHAYVNVATRGDLSSLRWFESPLKHWASMTDDKHKELCSVSYASLNFRDVMLATGKLPPDAIPGNMALHDCILGMEFSGHSSDGRRIMGLLPAKGLATTVDADIKFTWPVPESWTLREGATVPVVYATAYYALIVRGKLRKGERVLIHSGSGGVGQAAISVALHHGCEVFTTVGSHQKRNYLKHKFPQLQDKHFSNSRDASFEQEILIATKGKGVNVVLNSLADDKLQASVRLLAQHGRFLEIGKYDMSSNTPLGMAVFLRNIAFHGILLDALFDPDNDDWMRVRHLVAEGIASGAVRPLTATVFARDNVEEAFRFMAQGKHIGKVLVQDGVTMCPLSMENIRLLTMRSLERISRGEADKDEARQAEESRRTEERAEVEALIRYRWDLDKLIPTQCLVRLNEHMVTPSGGTGHSSNQNRLRYNKHILRYQQYRLAEWCNLGVKVEVSKMDASIEAQARQLIDTTQQVAPLGGIFHLAAVLRDGLFENQTAETFSEVNKSKMAAAVNLDLVTRDTCATSLDWFVVFSSVSCGRGNAGQTNYGYANSTMERICERRQRDGFPALAIQWGAIGDVGMARSLGGNDTVIGGTLPQRIASCMQTMDVLLNQPFAVVSSFVLAEKRGSGGASTQDSQVDLIHAVANVLGVKDVATLNAELTLGELGLDSLMGVEVKQTLERDFDLSLVADPARFGGSDVMSGVWTTVHRRCTTHKCAKSGILLHPSGYSFGACVAFEMALQLQQAQRTVGHLVLLDGSPVDIGAIAGRYRGRAHRYGVAHEVEFLSSAMCSFMMLFMTVDFIKVFIHNFKSA
ncbi:PREDICTED: fatty acid synthase-like [Priapulus caudatus]|uniref:Fatty acid synthase-like n=1 Tax=Priapulus caudatus TaxID=37621 RepID=A0ABM1EG51_PRICU|nr:PREDICTED: fatty acid synthase-like [Priapulus caudatus]